MDRKDFEKNLVKLQSSMIELCQTLSTKDPEQGSAIADMQKTVDQLKRIETLKTEVLTDIGCFKSLF